MAYLKPKDILDEFMDQLRADTGTTLSQCTFRKGPQHTARLASGNVGIVLVRVNGLPSGERPAGSGNTWWHDWQFDVQLLVPYDEADPEGTYDTTLDLLSDFLEFIDANRCIYTAKVGSVTTAEVVLTQFNAEDQQVWSAITAKVTYKALRS